MKIESESKKKLVCSVVTVQKCYIVEEALIIVRKLNRFRKQLLDKDLVEKVNC